MKAFAILIMTIFMVGCETTPPASRASIGSADSNYQPAESQPPVSLFSGDAAVLSDADIDRILRYKYTLPKPARIAILPLGQDRWFGYSDELARSGEEIRTSFIAQLRKDSSVVTASYLPTLLIPANRSVAHLREAATRYQADLLIVYQTSCRTYEKYKIFGANSSKSFCNIEAVMLDVRTGIVPFTTSATQEFVAKQSNDDSNFYETMRKAELTAIRECLVKIGGQVADYINAH